MAAKPILIVFSYHRAGLPAAGITYGEYCDQRIERPSRALLAGRYRNLIRCAQSPGYTDRYSRIIRYHLQIPTRCKDQVARRAFGRHLHRPDVHAWAVPDRFVFKIYRARFGLWRSRLYYRYAGLDILHIGYIVYRGGVYRGICRSERE